MNTEEWDYITRAGMEYEINTIRSQLEEARKELDKAHLARGVVHLNADFFRTRSEKLEQENAALKKEVEELADINIHQSKSILDISSSRDEFAMMFAEWFDNSEFVYHDNKENGNTYWANGNEYTMKELINQFKQTI